MAEYSRQDLKYAAEFREDIHREALAIVRKTRPGATEVMDRHPVEDYFQENWDYPGQWYTMVSIPYGYSSRKALIDAIVHETLSRCPPVEHDTLAVSAAEPKQAQRRLDDPFYALIADYPDCPVDYCIVKPDGRYLGYESHRAALREAWQTLFERDGEWQGDPNRAMGKSIPADTIFSSEYQDGNLNYRKAFLYPPHENCYTGKDFARVNEALFPNGTGELAVYQWTTDWADYFDAGHEWWGTLCLTVYDESLDRFVIMMASETD